MTALEVIRFALSAVCTLGGLFAILSGIVGVFRFRHAMSRLHAAALLDTAGLLLMLLGLMIAEGLTVTTLKMAALSVFLWLTSPISSHLIARMEVTINDELEKDMDVMDKAMVQHEKEGD